jgi:hypothetical protein
MICYEMYVEFEATWRRGLSRKQVKEAVLSHFIILQPFRLPPIPKLIATDG